MVREIYDFQYWKKDLKQKMNSKMIHLNLSFVLFMVKPLKTLKQNKIRSHRKIDDDRKVKTLINLTLNCIHIFIENYDSYTFKQNETLMDKAIYLRVAVLDSSKALRYENYYDKMQPYSGQKTYKCFKWIQIVSYQV